MPRMTDSPLLRWLLRHKLAVSTLDELANGHFQRLIPDSFAKDASQVKRVVACLTSLTMET